MVKKLFVMAIIVAACTPQKQKPKLLIVPEPEKAIIEHNKGFVNHVTQTSTIE